VKGVDDDAVLGLCSIVHTDRTAACRYPSTSRLVECGAQNQSLLKAAAKTKKVSLVRECWASARWCK
jgi:hypothetical protein